MVAFTVSGRVLDAEGVPPPVSPTLVVQAFDHVSVRSLTSVGSFTLTGDGTYSISWSQSSSTPVNLVVKVLEGSAERGRSRIIFGARAKHDVDIILDDFAHAPKAYKGRTEYDRISAAVEAAIPGVDAFDLNAADLEWICGAADIYPPYVALYVQARRLNHAHSGVSTKAFYGLGRRGMSLDLPKLLSKGPEAHSRALQEAYDRRIIPPPTSGTIEDEIIATLAGLRALVIDGALTIPDGGGRNLKEILDSAGFAAGLQGIFLEQWLTRTGTVEEFWSDLVAHPDFDADDVDLLKFTIMGATLTLQYIPAWQGLQAKRTATEITKIRDLAAWSVTDWVDFLEDPTLGPINAPDDMPGSTTSEKVQAYARLLERTIAIAHPTPVLARRIEAAGSVPNTSGVVAFLDLHDDFDITTTQLAKYIDENGITLLDLPQPTRDNILAVQRLHHVAPKHAKHQATLALLQNDYTSAHGIALKSKVDFVAQMSTAFDGALEGVTGQKMAAVVYETASLKSAATLMLMTQYSAAFSSLGTSAFLGTLPDLGTDPGLPTLKSLFGGLDYCLCKHCRSVYSPAAYLVDLLQFLAGSAGEGTFDTVLDVLFDRRPDLAHLELSCDNTNLVLPYIDLVNEILENAIEPQPGIWYQTAWSAADLALAPEHENADAYVPVAAAVYPWILPLQRWDDEVRIYLGHLGVPRHRLMEVLEASGTPTTQFMRDQRAEALGLTTRVRDIVTATALVPAVEEAEFWGLVQGAGWHTGLENVEEMLARSGLSYAELDELLHMRFIDPGEGTPSTDLSIFFINPGCQVADARIRVNGVTATLTTTMVDAIHRFVRLWRRVPLRPRELDAAIRDLGAGGITQDFIRSLSVMEMLRAHYGLGAFELLAWWANLDGRSYAWDGEVCLYNVLFQNRAVISPPVSAFALNAAGTELASTGTLSASQLPVVLAALRLRDTEYAALVASTFCSAGRNIANLSALHRHASFARALGIGVKDLITLRKISGQNPFSSPEATLTFVKMVDATRAAGFTLEELDYLARHQIDPYGKAVPTDAEIATTLTTFVRAIQSIDAELVNPGDPSGVVVRQHLQTVLAEIAVVETTMEILNRDPATSMTTGDQEAFIEAQFPAFMDAAQVDAAVDVLVTGPGLLTTSQARFEYVLDAILANLRLRRHEDALDQTIADAMKVERTAAHQLAFDLLEDPSASASSVRDALLDPALIAADLDASPITRGSQSRAFGAWDRTLKAALLVRGFSIPADQLTWFFTATPAPLWLDLNALPLTSTDDGATTFAAWDKIRREMDLRRSFRTTGNVHQEIASAANVNAAMAILADATGWEVADLQSLAGGSAFNLALGDLADETDLLRLRDAMNAVRQLGVSATEAWSWVNTAPSLPQSQSVRNAAKSHYDDSRWAEIAKPLQERLREGRRDALLAHLIASNDDFDDVSDVYGHFLIDIEMGGCMMTSRLKQAISSVQMFVQRALLNLEDDAKLLPAKAQQWKWMKSYRVWEANRKVFLYPENWVEPELRDDKSPFFTTLERDLRSNELDEVNVENAYKSYLLRLHEVADLEVVGCHHQQPDMLDEEPQDIFHVVARTRGTPHKFFYRRRIDDAYWTPWEEIPLEIEGDNVCPVVHQRRLFLFWTTFVEGSEKPQGENDEPLKFLQPIVQWSDFWNGEWTRQRSTRVSKRSRSFGAVDGVPLPSIFMKVYKGGFFAEDDALWVELSQISGAELPEVEGEDNALPGEANCTGIFTRYRYDDCTDRLTLRSVPDEVVGGGPGFEILAVPSYTGEELWAPAGTQLASQTFESTQEQGDYFRPIVQDPNTFELRPENVFQSTPDRFYVTYPQARIGPQSEASRKTRFFFSDARHTFYVTQREELLAYDEDRVPPDPGGSAVPHGQPSTPPVPIHVDESPIFEAIPIALDGINKTTVFQGVAPGLAHLALVKGQSPPLSMSTQGTVTLAATALKSAIATLGGSTVTTSGIKAIAQGSLENRFHFQEFHHPFTCLFLQVLNRWGIDGLLAPPDVAWILKRQIIFWPYFEARYAPTVKVALDYPVDDIDFRYGGAYSTYNWELFFHAPVLIAKRLTADQRFEDAMRWYHYVFNPMDTSEIGSPERFWNIKPFFLRADDFAMTELLVLLGYSGTPAEQEAAKTAFFDQVNEWRKQPFRPHAIARLRPEAYAKSVVMGYLDNLLAWADSLFRRDTIETINEATQLYVLAAEILGKRPVQVPEQPVAPRTWLDLAGTLDEFSNAKVQLENFPLVKEIGKGVGDQGNWMTSEELPQQDPPVLGWYFCFPPNDRLLAYWDTVADRLFKIRHCMNIEGVVRQLPLFEPPIDPALLVKAVAAGVDISSAIQDVNAPLPRYRFQVLLQRAMDFCGEVRSLGAALLSALEKRDGEQLALLRSSQEIGLLKAVEDVRKQQLAEARANVDALTANYLTVAQRQAHYEKLLADGLSDQEKAQLVTFAVGTGLQTAGGAVSLVGSFLYLVPDIEAGAILPYVSVKFGGKNLGDSIGGVGQALTLAGSLLKDVSSILGMQAGWKRRAQEWQFNVDTAKSELAAMLKQIAAAQVRVAIAELELANHRRQIENAQKVDELMRTKYTNEELYEWMIAQVSELHFRAYQLAYDMARRAERAYRFELDVADSSFVSFGYWENLKKGLMSGERLQLDLRRMDASYLSENRRELELTKSIPLSQLDAVALVKLRENGSCFFRLPEAIFDLDHPGHYLRRIRSASITLPAVAGPYVAIAAKLTLLRDEVRFNALPASPYARDDDPEPDGRFRDRFDGVSAIATSTGQNDAGMFELNFRDERYLPFEGAGAISNWKLDLTEDLRQFDYRTISDVIIHVSYTARDAGVPLRNAARDSLRAQLSAIASAGGDAGLMRLFSVRQQFPVEWNAFLFPPDDAELLHLDLPLGYERFPYVFQSETILIQSVEMVLVLAEGVVYAGSGPSALVLPLAGGASPLPISLTIGGYGPSPTGEGAYAGANPPPEPGAFSVELAVGTSSDLDGVDASVANTTATPHRLRAENIRDLLLIVHYTLG